MLVIEGFLCGPFPSRTTLGLRSKPVTPTQAGTVPPA